MRQRRKAERVAVRKRLLEVMRAGECSANVLAERFGMHPVYVRKVAREEGVALPRERDAEVG